MERVRAQIDFGAIGAVAPKEIVKALETKTTETSNRGMLRQSGAVAGTAVSM